MESQVRRLIISHAIALVLLAGIGYLWQGLAGTSALVVGLLSFSVPVIVFSFLVLRASFQNPQKFWGRFMVAEAVKWVFASAFLGLALASHWFLPIALMAGFFVSVLVQLVYPILVKRGSET